jgi:hypothetical protein
MIESHNYSIPDCWSPAVYSNRQHASEIFLLASKRFGTGTDAYSVHSIWPAVDSPGFCTSDSGRRQSDRAVDIDTQVMLCEVYELEWNSGTNGP